MSPRYLVDTDVCAAFLNAEDVRLRERWLSTPAAQLALCSVVRGELESGAWGTADPYGVLAKLDRMLHQYVSLAFDDRVAGNYGRLISDLRRSGRELGAADTMIAAIALTHDLAVVTRNLRHFKRVKGLEVVRW